METNPIIEAHIRKWRQQLHREDFLEDGVIEELEDHLRQTIAKLLTAGLSPDDAFEKARIALGSPDDISRDERMARYKGDRSPLPLLMSYAVIGWRRAVHKKFISVINVTGLALGVGISVLLGVYAHDIITYDQFHEQADDIYFLYRTRPLPGGGQLDVSDTWPMLAEEVQQAFPSVTNIARFVFGGQSQIRIGDDEFLENVTFTEQGMFDMFSFPIIRGNRTEVFREPNSVVISQEVAKRLFGSDDPIGKSLRIVFDEPKEYLVTGVLGKIPFNSSFQFDVVVNLESRRPSWTEWGYFGWQASFMFSFVQLREGQDPDALEDQFPQIVQQFVHPSEQGTLELMPLGMYYDFNTGQQQYGYFLGYIAMGLLLIAFFNFTNLNTAQSMLRSREVAVRKVFGAGRTDLALQFIGETTLIFSIGCILGVGMAFVLLPYFISLFGQQMSLSFLIEGVFPAVLLLIIISFGVLAGTYPTLNLSRLRAGDAMRGKQFKIKRTFDPKNMLVTLQFAIAIMLISSVLIIYQQIDYMRGADMKFDPENVMIIQAGPGGEEDDQPRFTAFMNALETLPGVTTISSTNSVPGRYRGSYVLVQPDDALNQPPLDWRFVDVDDRYFSAMGIDVVEGRDFDENMSSDERKAIINEAALKQLGWTSVEGRKLIFPDSDEGEGFDLVGVVEDFNYQSLVTSIEPVIHVFRGRTSDRYGMVLVRLDQWNVSGTIREIETAWNTYEPNRPMDYSFLDQDFKSLYDTEERIGTMTLYATCMAIFVAILGVLGLASFKVVERMKEMAIRKVLGASIRQLLMLLLKQTTLLLVIALVLAVPVNYMVMKDWLADFAFRIELNGLVYVLTFLIITSVSWLVLGGYTLKAIRTNPVKALRNE